MNTSGVISEEDSKRITSLRFLLICLVVFIHNNLTANDAINYYHLAFNEPVVITYFKILITSIFGKAAVPLFFLFAGYLQFAKDDNYPTLLRKKCKSLLIPYVAWTLLNVLLFFVAQKIPQTAKFFIQENNIVRNWNLIDWINLFWRHNYDCPFVYQLWFVRNLFVLVIFSPIFSFCIKRVPYFTIIMVFLCYFNPTFVPLSFNISIFFYIWGGLFAEYKLSFFKISDMLNWIEYAILILLLFIVEIFDFKINFYGFDLIIKCFFFLKLSGYIIKREKLFRITSYLSAFSFFLYAIHTPFLGTSLNKISHRVIPLHDFWCLIQFILPVLLCIVIGTVIGILLKKICPPLFTVFNGSRR